MNEGACMNEELVLHVLTLRAGLLGRSHIVSVLWSVWAVAVLGCLVYYSWIVIEHSWV
jgi:hypothetical protein